MKQRRMIDVQAHQRAVPQPPMPMPDVAPPMSDGPPFVEAPPMGPQPMDRPAAQFRPHNQRRPYA